MFRLLIAASLFGLTVRFPLNAQEAKDGKDPRWTALSIQVTKIPPAKFPLHFDGDAGVKITALLHVPEKYLITIDEKQSTIASVTDDTNLDLLQGPRKSALTNKVIFFGVKASEEGNYIAVPIHTPGWPAASAKKVRVKGAIAVVMGSQAKTIERKDVDLATGLDLDFGAIKKRETKGTSKSSKLSLGYSYAGSKPLKTVNIINASGKELDFRLVRTRGTKDNPFTASITAGGLKGKEVGRCTVRISYFDAVETVVVPLELEVGLGLQPVPKSRPSGKE